VFFATQIDIAPPTIALVVNNPAFFEDSYQRHIINRMRDLLPYPEVPIRLLIRPRGQRTNEAALDELDETGAKEAGAKVKVPKSGRRTARPSARQNRAKNRGRKR
jgi:GTP-binding protein